MRRRIAEALDPDLRHATGLSRTNLVFAGLILISTAMVVLETEPSVFDAHRRIFFYGERLVGTIFVIEYIVRAWCAQENPQFGRGLKGLLGYVFSVGSLVDLLAIVPSLFLFQGQATLSLRIFRVLRMLRVARLGRLSNAWTHMINAIAARREELFLAFAAGLILMLVSSTLLYMAEGTVQPDKFGSIPRAMWWSIVTLTTIGYGDAVPVTLFGKILAAFTAFCGIGLIAMPTGIIAAALSDSVQLRRMALQAELERERREADKEDSDEAT
ncbi:MAG: ion transporter [Caulobacteraceae bacterium]